MVLRHLRYFAVVADEGSVSKAALELHVAQPALSRQIQELEARVGVDLLRRTPKGVQLTPAGRVLRDDVHAIMHRLEDVVERAWLTDIGALATVRLGIGRLALEHHTVRRLLETVRQEYSQIELVVTVAERSAQQRLLRDHALDMAIDFGQTGERVSVSHQLAADTIDSVMVSVSHAFAACATISADMLRGGVLRLDRALIEGTPAIGASLNRLGVEFRRDDSIETVLAYVAAGDGCTVGPSSLADRPPAGMRIVPLDGFAVPMPLRIYWRRGVMSPGLEKVASIALRLAGAASYDATHAGRMAPGLAQPAEPPDRAVAATRVDERQLAAFVAAVDEGSVTAAARALGLSPRAVSRQVRQLSQTLGVALTRDTRHGVIVTAAGREVCEQARVILALIDESLDRVRRRAAGITDRCVISTLPLELTGDVLSRVITRLSHSHPEIAVVIREPNAFREPVEIAPDLSIVGTLPGTPEDTSLASVVIRDDPLSCALLAAEHPLASHEWLRTSELAFCPFFFIPRQLNPRLYDAAMRAFVDTGVVIQPASEQYNARVIWAHVAESTGWALVPASMRRCSPSGTVAIPIEGVSLPRELRLVWWPQSASAALRAVIDAFRA